MSTDSKHCAGVSFVDYGEVKAGESNDDYMYTSGNCTGDGKVTKVYTQLNSRDVFWLTTMNDKKESINDDPFGNVAPGDRVYIKVCVVTLNITLDEDYRGSVTFHSVDG